MSTHNIRFRGEVRKILYPLLSVAMLTVMKINETSGYMAIQWVNLNKNNIHENGKMQDGKCGIITENRVWQSALVINGGLMEFSHLKIRERYHYIFFLFLHKNLCILIRCILVHQLFLFEKKKILYLKLEQRCVAWYGSTLFTYIIRTVLAHGVSYRLYPIFVWRPQKPFPLKQIV